MSDRLKEALRSPPWCYDEGGQQFAYITPETAREALDLLEKQQRALELAGEVLEDIDEIDMCDCQAFCQDEVHYRDDCMWTKTQAALTAIKKTKEG